MRGLPGYVTAVKRTADSQRKTELPDKKCRLAIGKLLPTSGKLTGQGGRKPAGWRCGPSCRCSFSADKRQNRVTTAATATTSTRPQPHQYDHNHINTGQDRASTTQQLNPQTPKRHVRSCCRVQARSDWRGRSRQDYIREAAPHGRVREALRWCATTPFPGHPVAS